ncbi:MAG: hypothetical protein M1829_002525 [Trizodia sp. TS-e1964]|nr:MAG: hypothetical protein M1829_002525 [Trizodia sp. TS-e1964]
MSRHQAVLESIVATVRTLYRQKEPFRIFHGSTNSTRPGHHDKVVDISSLRNVLHIDPARKTALVEPNVPMDKLVAATLRHGLVPPVVMEFPGITVGGGFSGSAGESSSFRYGYFDQTVNWAEIILANGDVVRASNAENQELFKGAAGGAGTLGITTLLELQLIPAKKYVRTTYRRTTSIQQAVDEIQAATQAGQHDYVDGIVFSRDLGVIITGTLTDDKPASATEQTFSRPWDPWYYLHVQERLKQHSSDAPPLEDYIPLPDYLFRYDRGGFWVGLEAFRYFGMLPFTALTRWFLNDFMHTRMLFRALHGSRRSFGYMVQDLSLPYPTAAQFMHYAASSLNIWPLWLCPLKEISPPSFHPWTERDGVPQPMLNIGLWGKAADELGAFVAQNRGLETRLQELGGRKVLYSHTYYTESEFWRIYDREWYDALRRKFHALTLPSIYEKVKVDAGQNGQAGSWAHWLRNLWPFAGLLGIVSAIRSREYLLHRSPVWWGAWMEFCKGKRE